MHFSLIAESYCFDLKLLLKKGKTKDRERGQCVSKNRVCCFVQNISTNLLGISLPLHSFIYLPPISKFLRSCLVCSTGFSSYLGHIAFEEYHKNYWTFPQKEMQEHKHIIFPSQGSLKYYMWLRLIRLFAVEQHFLLKGRYRFNRSGRCLRFCISNKLLDDVNFVVSGTAH